VRATFNNVDDVGIGFRALGVMVPAFTGFDEAAGSKSLCGLSGT
jgi:hypothetical protein